MEQTYAQSSKGFCIFPRVKYPKSPPDFALLQSEISVAICSKVVWPSTIRFFIPDVSALSKRRLPLMTSNAAS